MLSTPNQEEPLCLRTTASLSSLKTPEKEEIPKEKIHNSARSHYAQGIGLVHELKLDDQRKTSINELKFKSEGQIASNKRSFSERAQTQIDMKPNKLLEDRNCVGCSIF